MRLTFDDEREVEGECDLYWDLRRAWTELSGEEKAGLAGEENSGVIVDSFSCFCGVRKCEGLLDCCQAISERF